MGRGNSQLSGYRILWIMALFDLPVMTKPERKRATAFRSFLLDEGFSMMQFSCYVRFTAGKEQADAITRRIGRTVPADGLFVYGSLRTGGRRHGWIQRTEPEGITAASAPGRLFHLPSEDYPALVPWPEPPAGPSPATAPTDRPKPPCWRCSGRWA